VGAWSVVELTTTDSTGTQAIRPTQPGFYLFTESHYSIVRVTSTEPRPDFPPAGTAPTAEQYSAIWGPLTAQSGTYTMEGDEVTTRPLAAKNPAVMAAGNFLTNQVRLAGDSLWWTNTGGRAGPVANPGTLKLVRAD